MTFTKCKEPGRSIKTPSRLSKLLGRPRSCLDSKAVDGPRKSRAKRPTGTTSVSVTLPTWRRKRAHTEISRRSHPKRNPDSESGRHKSVQKRSKGRAPARTSRRTNDSSDLCSSFRSRRNRRAPISLVTSFALTHMKGGRRTILHEVLSCHRNHGGADGRSLKDNS
jgi:hypothetical protein